MPMAIVTGLLLAGLLLATLFTNRVGFLILVAVAVLAAQMEVYRALGARGHQAAQTIGVAAGAVILIGAYLYGPRALTFGLVLGVLATLFWFVVDPDHGTAAEGISATLFGVVYP
ncbi:MAG: hypothetical protein ABR552_08145, partial [Actinomycetota bacterium]